MVKRVVIVKPETVVRWHRAGFRLYWRWRSRQRGDRPRINEEIRTLIRRLAAENADWGAPRIHGELLKLGFDVSERSVARYLRRVPRRGDPATRWSAFLANHREAIVACDFFTVPTLNFQLLSCFFVRVTFFPRTRPIMTDHRRSWLIEFPNVFWKSWSGREDLNLPNTIARPFGRFLNVRGSGRRGEARFRQW
jgi:hypothetical protein